MPRTYKITINGQETTGENGTLNVVNPATEEVFAYASQASGNQLEQAVQAAQKAFISWKETTLDQRKSHLKAIAIKLEEHQEELAKLITLEQGKPHNLAMMEVGGAIGWLQATIVLDLPVKVIEDSAAKRIELHRKPLGVVASITPWNWPVMIAAWHIFPALLAGNTVISKPSELTPVATLRMVELMAELLPKGVINSVCGSGEIGAAISQHPGINKIVFTGSTLTGQAIMRSAAGNLKRLTLELGGNDAGIVLPNADPEKIAPAIFQSAFLNMGQTCAALKRLYVHDSIHDALCGKLTDIANQQIVGDGMLPETSFGPVQNLKQLQIVKELVEDAVDNGATVLCGGEPLQQKGYFYPPTLVTNVDNGCRLVDEEQFGPVLPIISYSDINAVIKKANDSENGLGGSVWSSDLEQAAELAKKLETGTTWVNNHAEVLPHAPFGGAKMSGIGVEFGEEGLEEYTQIQVLSITK